MKFGLDASSCKLEKQNQGLLVLGSLFNRPISPVFQAINSPQTMASRLGAGDGDRTHALPLGKRTFYH